MPNTALPVEQIPQCLRDRPQWDCWKYVERDGRQTKVPVNARSGRNASATDPQTWTTFQAAHDAYLRSDQLAGVGFVFTKDATCSPGSTWTTAWTNRAASPGARISLNVWPPTPKSRLRDAA